jgi:hypothetical protein
VSTTVGRPRSCSCGTCAKCKRADYQRRWWNNLTPAQRREKTARRDAAKVREQDRRKQAKRRESGTAEQKLKIKARDEVRKARLRGDLVPLPCEVCGNTKTHAHHDDYRRPLDVRWLCRKHHEEEHAST